ncbi:glycosyltransferase [Chitinophaga agrisoli]|uniref:Glycosyltransferase n=1 Tax=Chitinophaga agrisoli TaxID=2607653 RepID=A0A5B2W3A4_9BACT|nr:glycosyltransferase [Chitinophaga agrisoli]KAA2245368.1 glycosyltransferase [Chitinophaga agrisoli]
MRTPKKASPPSRMELWTLRLMILIGAGGMGYFLYSLANPLQVGYAPFYWLLLAATVFNCLRVLHEWYHYFYITVPPTPPLTKTFTVDIFTTFCAGEPYPMIVETLEAIQAISYPHTTYLCDEADDPYLKEVCRRLGVQHVTRTVKRNAKAGNINNALQQATGELCVVLDPDHVPLPGFLDAVLPHFSNEQIGFVQVVQAYDNLKDSLIAKGAAQQTFQFYGPMMMTMNRYGTVLAIGANCTFRRAALDSIGGHAAGLSEDMHTAMQLHAKGWKSVYVPEVLTYGLVPSTLSAYYKQQLKWARGTFELLVTSYPRLFKQFSWRQRLHYGTIPFHYFSGVIFLINFLVPILSLTLDLIPFRMDLLSFMLVALPFMSTTLAIRHFVQRWVMGENERGNHVVGGLLLIGTWWIYILGFVYTIIRKKIPYIPTPKDDTESDNWKLNIPNGIMALLSLLAIVYGLHRDWNPYTWVMAGIAAMNSGILLFNIVISRRNDLKRIKQRFTTLKELFVYWLLFKRQLWWFRHGLYTGIRRFALLFIMGISLTVLYCLTGASGLPAPAHRRISKQQIFYAGIFDPVSDNGLSSMQHINRYQLGYDVHFGIVSLYIPWGDEERCYLPQALVDSIYRQGACPMITWEPWEGLFKRAAGDDTLRQEKKVFAHVVQGNFDRYLEKMAAQLRALNRPVYLRFAHEADNPQYPWSATGDNTPEEFKAAWQYVHDFFVQHKVYNIIWVWNPWKPEAAAAYFPGAAYVDWLGVTSLNYAKGAWSGFRELYAPFHQLPLFRTGLPVMVAEGGSLREQGRQEQWLSDAFTDINTTFREIKAFVLFNSDLDKRLPAGDSGTLHWKLQHPGTCFAAIKAQQSSRGYRASTRQTAVPALPVYNSPVRYRRLLPDSIRGINYQKGQHWYRNFYALTSRELARDMEGMQQLGINTIKRTGPGVYDRNILAAAASYNMQLHYCFDVPEIRDVFADKNRLDGVTAQVISTVQSLKNNKHIIAWNIGNTRWQQLDAHFYKPTLLYQQQAYFSWLKKLVNRIKALDPLRPVTMDVAVNNSLQATIRLLQQELPEIDAFGLVINDIAGAAQLQRLPAQTFISSVSAPQYLQLTAAATNTYINSWQDTGEKDHLTFDGLLDHWGRHKREWQLLAAHWGHATASTLPELRILRPARLTKINSRLTYHAMVPQNASWIQAGALPLHFEWRLVKMDAGGNAVLMKNLGQGPAITLDIPQDPGMYELYLSASRGNEVTTTQTSLNIPL